MFPAKMVKELLYAMFSQKFVSITEIAKTADHAPSRTFYCFNVPTEQLTKQLQDHNYRSILNLMAKRAQILAENRSVSESDSTTLTSRLCIPISNVWPPLMLEFAPE